MIKFPPERIEAHEDYRQMFERDFPLYYTCIVYKNNWEAEVNHINLCIAKGKPAPEIKLPEGRAYDSFDYIDPPQEPDTSEEAEGFDLEETLRKAEEGDLEAKWDIVYHMALSGKIGKNADPEDNERYYTYLLDLADAGNKASYIMLGDAILKGVGCAQSTADALQWYEKAVESGVRFGNEMIGEIYYSDKYIPANYKTAFEYFTKDEGQKSFCTRYYLGEMYRQGLYVEKDPAKAYEYYASIVNDKSDWRELDDYYWRACYRLGVATHYGEGCETDPERALELLKLAREFAEKRDDAAVDAEISLYVIDQELNLLDPNSSYDEFTKGHPCIAFEMSDAREAFDHMSLERVIDYGGRGYGHSYFIWDKGGRFLCKCKKCGGYVLVQDDEYHDFCGGDDGSYADYIPVSSPEEADEINKKYSGWDIEHNFPRRFLMWTNGKLGWSLTGPSSSEEKQ